MNKIQYCIYLKTLETIQKLANHPVDKGVANNLKKRLIVKYYLESEYCGINHSKRVYLFTWDCENGDIFISEYSDMPFKALLGFYIHEVMKIKNFHLHEYPSFEDAYSVATDMKEGNKLCYDNSYELN